MPRSGTSILPFLIVPLVVFLVHAHSLGNSFHYDDGHSLLRNPHIRSLENLPTFFTDPRTFSENPDYAMYRPLVLVAHALNYAWGAYDPAGYQLLNLIIHCLASLLVYLLLLQLQLPPGSALLGALLFGLHPAQTEPVNFISSRSESLAALFYLGSFYSYLRATPQTRSTTTWGWYSLSLVSAILALLSKATAITLPVMLLAHSFLNLHKQDKKQIVKIHCPYWILSASYLVLYRTLAAQGLERAGQVRSLTEQLATQSKAFVHYLKLTFFPVDMNVHQQFSTSSSIFEATPFIALLGGTSLFAIAFTKNRHKYLFIFGLSWFFIILLPTFIVPLHILVNDHRLYLSILGFALIISALFTSVKKPWALYLLCALFALISFQRDEVWKNEITLWEDAVSQAPLMPEASYNLGHAYHLAGNLPQARKAYERAVELSPEYARAQSNLGAIYREDGRLPEAIRAFQMALKVEPEMVETLNNLGLVYGAQGRLDESIALFQQALRLNPDLAEIWYNLGLVYRDKGQMQEAAQALQKALQLNPEIKNRFPAGQK